MSHRYNAYLPCALFVFALIGVSQNAEAADFKVATRDDVLVLTSKVQATQFLTHATFGGTKAEIDALALRMRTIGTVPAANEWIDAQVAIPASSQSALERKMFLDDVPYWTLYNRTGVAPDYVYTPRASTITTEHAMSRSGYRTRAWWHNALAGQDQLRLKTAWALSQVFSVSRIANGFDDEEFESSVSGGPSPTRSRFQGLSNYYDIFSNNAFGKFRDILGKVTYHGTMGDWLSFRGNRRAAGGIFPDENYAREVMQLFTIGLYVLNNDGSQQTNAAGPISTYDADDIREYAQVFTGLGYGYGTYSPSSSSLNPYSPYTGTVSADPNGSTKYQVPMRMAPSQHDRGPKYLLNGLVLPSTIGTTGSPTNTDADSNNTTSHTEISANAEIDAALNGLFNHQSCPPFIVQRLIQRFVKSNPSKAYVGRVVAKFKNNGQNVRGDMKEVVRAILTDPEAWQPIRVQYVRSPSPSFVVSTMGSEDSRLQEPVCNFTRFVRFFKGSPEYQKATSGTYPTVVPTPAANIISNEFRIGSLDATFDQNAYDAPSVFNFYLAEFRPTGEFQAFPVSSRIPTGVLVAPEFNIVNAITANATTNFYRGLISTSLRSDTIQTIGSIAGNTITGTSTTNTANVTTLATESTRSRVTFDFSEETTLALGTNVGLPWEDDVLKLIEHLDLYLCGGTLHPRYKLKLGGALIAEITRVNASGVSNAEALEIARGAVLSIVTSPSFLVTE
ncbi:MAG: DUF1800 family protein [Pirellulaceae bacterium]|nr:DUF1800 family protein [Pirellulaceae bacterium]